MGNKQLLERYIRKRSDAILSPRKYLQRHHSRHRDYAFSFKVQRLIFQFSKTFIFSLEHFLSDALAMSQTSFSDFLKCDSGKSSSQKKTKSQVRHKVAVSSKECYFIGFLCSFLY